MILHVDRIKNNGNATIGHMYIDGKYECYTLEDEPRDVKVFGETRIPEGTYDIKLRTEGTTHESYKKRFPGIHRGTLHLQNVEGFEYILIHIGNTDKDTAGCILVGEKEKNYKLINSTIAYKRLYSKIIKAIDNGEEIKIKITNEAL